MPYGNEKRKRREDGMMMKGDGGIEGVP